MKLLVLLLVVIVVTECQSRKLSGEHGHQHPHPIKNHLQKSRSPKQFANGLDLSNAVQTSLPGGKTKQCVEKTEFRQEFKKDPVLSCVHREVEQCHYTYKTIFKPTVEDVCEESFMKICSIQYRKVASNETHRHCYRPLVQDCGAPTPTPTPRPLPPTLPPCPTFPPPIERRTPLAFVVDVTKSNAKDKLSISDLSNSILDMVMDMSHSIPQFILTEFHDKASLGPGRIPIYSEDIKDNVEVKVKTDDAEEFRTAVQDVSFGDNPGYDTKERMTQGLYRTLQEIDVGGLVLVFTDAGTKNLNLEDSLLDLIAEKEAAVYVILTPKYQGRVGDASWNLYNRIGKVFNIDNVPIDQVLSAIEAFIIEQGPVADQPPCDPGFNRRQVRQASDNEDDLICKVHHETSCTTRYVEKSPGKFVGDTSCEKIPVTLCGRSDCKVVPGPQQCHDKVTASLVDQPEEHCDLSPQKTCHHKTTLVPRLEPVHQCTLVPKEVCSIKYVNARFQAVPFQTLWCLGEDEQLQQQVPSIIQTETLPFPTNLEPSIPEDNKDESLPTPTFEDKETPTNSQGYSYPVPKNKLELPKKTIKKTVERVTPTPNNIVRVNPLDLQAIVLKTVRNAVQRAVAKAVNLQEAMKDKESRQNLLRAVQVAVSQSVRTALQRGAQKHNKAANPQEGVDLEQKISLAVRKAVEGAVKKSLVSAGKANMMKETVVKDETKEMELSINTAINEAVRDTVRNALTNNVNNIKFEKKEGAVINTLSSQISAAVKDKVATSVRTSLNAARFNVRQSNLLATKISEAVRKAVEASIQSSLMAADKKVMDKQLANQVTIAIRESVENSVRRSMNAVNSKKAKNKDLQSQITATVQASVEAAVKASLDSTKPAKTTANTNLNTRVTGVGNDLSAQISSAVRQSVQSLVEDAVEKEPATNTDLASQINDAVRNSIEASLGSGLGGNEEVYEVGQVLRVPASGVRSPAPQFPFDLVKFPPGVASIDREPRRGKA